MGNRLDAGAGRVHALVFGFLLCAAVGCRAPGPPPAQVRIEPDPAARGAVVYAAYCRGCHGPEGHGDGPVASVFNLHPADLRDPTLLAGASDAELVGRLLEGTPLRTSPRRNAVAEELQVTAIADYLPTLSRRNWDQLRAGRSVYEKTCAPCHGAYGNGEGVLAGTKKRAFTDLQETREYYTDRVLVEVIERGSGAMPPLVDSVDPGHMRALVAYVRHLSKGYKIYDTYCTGCHGDDGHGSDPKDVRPPAQAAPALHATTLAKLTPEEQRAKILHMLRRAQSMMPHFRNTLDEHQLLDVVAYLRSW